MVASHERTGSGADRHVELGGLDAVDSPALSECVSDLVLRDTTRALSGWLLIAETQHVVTTTSVCHVCEALDEVLPVLVIEHVKESAVQHDVELLAERFKTQRAGDDGPRAAMPRSCALACASRIAVGDTSMPTVAHPASAAMSACSPVPHPTSSTSPPIAPSAVSFANAGCGRPMSHGGVVAYAASNSATRSRRCSLTGSSSTIRVEHRGTVCAAGGR